ncbi:MAG TPA: RHS repeat-associated core domain-containing protein [Herpetosiphonaceae bacterium]
MKAISRAHALLRVLLIFGLLLSSLGPSAYSQPTARAASSPDDISYIYDEAGRLTGVVDPGGDAATYSYDEVGNISSIARRPATQLGLIEFTPNAGPVGTTVTLYGTGFSATAADNVVKFNGVTATVTSASATQIVVSVPASATSGTLSITTQGATVTSSTPFTVQAAAATPQITAFTPTVGAPGTVVTIDGANFEAAIANNKVGFNGTLAHLTSVTSTRIETTVPTKAASGRLSVATPAGKVVSSSDFFVPPSGFTAADIDVTGRMAIGESKAITLGTANKIAMILFDGSQGQQVSLNLTGVTIPSTSVSILSPDGSTLGSVSIGTNGGLLDNRTLPATGTYTILVDPGSTYTGNITLNLYNAADVISQITPGGPALNIATTVPGQNARLTFNGSAGQKVSLGMSSVTIPSSYVSILKPDGTALVGATSIGTGGGLIEAQTLPTAGTYTILVDPQGTYTGGMTLTLYDAPDVTATITPGGAAVSVTTIVPGQFAKLTFNGTQGQRIALLVTSATKAYDLLITKPDGTTLWGWGGVGTNSYIDTTTLPATGTYTITVNPRGSELVTTALTLYDVPADLSGSIIVGGDPVTTTTTAVGQNARLTFEGTQGQRIALLVTSATKAYDLLITKPDGTNLWGWGGVGTNSYIDTTTLPATGTYSININPRGTETLTTSIKLYDVPADLSGSIIVGGDPVTTTTTAIGQNARLTFEGTQGQRIALLVTSATKAYDLLITKPDGTTLWGWGGVGTNSYIDTTTLPATGTYTITINPRGTETLTTAIKLYDVPADVTGTITAGGPAASVTTTSVGQNAKLTFEGTQGQRIALLVTSATKAYDLLITKPDGTTLWGWGGVGTNSYIDTTTLPASGTYSITINPRGTETLTTNLTLYDVPADVTGTITPGGPAASVTTTAVGQNAKLTFTGTQGQRVSLLVNSTTKAYDLLITKPDGNGLWGWGGVGTNSYIDTLTLPANGTYTININPRGTETLTTNLTLYDVQPDVTGTITPGGPAVNIATTVPGQNARLTFSGTVGQRVSVSLGSVTITSSYVSLLKPDGSTLTYISVGTGGGFIDAQTLPTAGTYTILVDPQSTYTGQMAVTLHDAADVTGTITPGGPAVTVTTNVPGQNARLTFSGTQGQQVSLSMTNVTLQGSYVSILKPDGSTLVSSSYIGTGGGSIDARTLPSTGTYTILVDGYSTYTGRMSLTLYDVPTDIISPIVAGGSPVTVTTTVAGQNAKLTFSGTVGQRISISLGSVTISSSYVSLLKPDGTALVGATSIGTGGGFIDVQTLPTAGTYTILVDPQGTATGRMVVTLHDATEATGTITPGGPAASVTTTVPGQNAKLTFTGTQGQRIAMLVNTTTRNYDLRILKPDGTQLIGWWGTCTGCYYDTISLPTSGSYIIEINPRGTDTLTTSLTVYDVPADVTATITPGGADATVTTTGVGQNAKLTFTGTQGQRIALLVTSASKGYDLLITKPDGTTLWGWGGVGTNSYIDTTTLPATGTYSININPRGTDTLTTAIRLYDVPADLSGSIIVGGDPVTTTTTAVGQNAKLTFNGTQGQRIALLVTSASKGYDLLITKPDGTTLWGWGGVGTNSYIDTTTLPATGTYSININPRGTDTLTTAIKLYDVPADLSGSIIVGGDPVTTTTTAIGQNAKLTFSGTQGQRIALLVTSASKGYDLLITKPDGTGLWGWGGVGTNSYIDTTTLPATGTYSININPRGTDTLTTSIKLYDVPADATGTIVAGGSPETVTTTAVGQNAKLTFTGTQGQRIALLVNSASKGYDLLITKPDGNGLWGWGGVGTNSYIDTLTLPTSGTYGITINPRGTDTLTTNLTLYDVPADLSGTITPGGADATVTTTAIGQNAKLTFTGTQGQRISLQVISASKGYDLLITKPDGNGLWGWGGVGTGSYVDVLTLPTSGTYGITINPRGTDTLTTALRLNDVPADITGSLTTGGPSVTVTPSVPGQNARLTFTGSANERIRLTLSGVTIPSSYVSILRPDNSSLTGTSVGTSGGSLTPTLPVAGTYTVVVDPSSTYTGGMTLSLSLYTASAQSLKTAAAQPVTAEIAAIGAHGTLALGAPAGGTSAVAERPLSEKELAIVGQGGDDEFWAPDPRNMRNWQTGRPRSAAQDLPPLQATPGVTALTGQVLDLRGRPLSDVTLEIEDRSVTTDKTGRFLLEDVEPGHHELVIDGATASKPGRRYGIFEVGVDIVAGQTNILPYTIWLPKLDTAHTVKVTSPTTEEIVLTTPYIPGLEVRIPKGTVITDDDDQPVTEIELGITPIPVDRTPFPLPQNVYVPIYFTIQPGGTYVKPFARIIYPNYDNEPEGKQISFFHYDPEEKGWFVYGQGKVMPGGKQIEPDPGVGIYEFTGAMIGTGGNPPGDGPTPGNDDDDGDPVDLSTGMFVLDKTDLIVPDVMPLVLNRTYRPGDTVVRPFGIGTTHPYQSYMWSAQQYRELDLILPDGGRVHYLRISPGTGWTDAVFEHVGSTSKYHKSIVRWNGNSGWDLILKDGTVYTFPQYSPLQSIRDRHGNRITISRSGGSTGNITQVTSSNGRWITFTYDTSNRITQAKDNVGRTVNYTYDASGRLWKVTDPAGGVTEYTYDASHRMLTIKDARGITFLTNEYDTNGRVRKQTQADASTYLFAYTLDTNGKVTRTDVTDPRGNVRRVTFNASGHTLTDTYAVGTPQQQTITYEREAGTNLLLSMIDQAGRKTAYTYDAMGNMTSVTRLADTANAVTTRLTYDSRFNRVASITDPLGHASTFTYDTRGNLAAITDPLGRRATLTYNGAGQVVAVTNPLNQTIRFTYEGGDLASAIDPLGRSTGRFTDSIGRLVSQTNARGVMRRYDYNALSLPVRLVDPTGGVSQLGYDQNGNLITIQDARGNTTSYTYNNMDRLASRTDPLGRAEQYLYDAGGNVTQVTDRKGQVSVFQYDALNRNTFAGFGKTGNGNQYQSTLSYAYTAVNLVAKITDSQAGEINFGYDDLNRLVSEASAQGAINYAYDAAGRQVSMQVAGQPVVNYTYDDANRLTRITQGSAAVAMAYDDASRLTSMNLPTGISMAYNYDDASQMTGIGYKLGTTTIGDLTYGYDATGKVSSLGGSYARTGMPQPVTSATYDAANRLTQWGSRSLTYDANGNLTNDGTNTYTWNARNQLVGHNGTGLSASFQYDGTGRRIGKTVNSAATGFMHDGRNIVQELANGTPTSNLLTGLGIDQTFTRTSSSTETLLTDRLGSTLALVDGSGAVQTEYTYDPFGNTTASGAPNANASQYTGRENDGTGLYYYRARYYSPTFQRFISEDPMGFAGGDVNLYAYVGNSPTNFTDPRGLFLDTLADIGFIAYDLYKVFTGGRKNLGENLMALGLDVAGALIPFATGLGAAGRAASHADDAYDALRAAGKGCSFSGDTPVSTEDGAKPIRDIKVGDRVLAYNEVLDSTGSYTVTAVWSHHDPVVERLTIDGEQLETTPEHPFYTEEHGWVPAGHLQVGAHVRTADGTPGTVQAVEFAHDPQPMYNLTVDQAHTYYVGEEQALVHNTCPVVQIPRSRYPETAKHIEDAQAAGHPSELTIDRGGAKANRSESLKGHPTVPGKDRDEYPPAMFREGGSGASVRPINPSDNRGAGSCMSHQCSAYPDGTRVRIEVVP